MTDPGLAISGGSGGNTVQIAEAGVAEEAPAAELPWWAGRLAQWQWGVVLLLLGSHAVLAWLFRQPAVATGNDDALYLLLARSLRHFHYLDSHLVNGTVHSQYPPVYPALLGLFNPSPGQPIGVLVAAGIACSLLSLVLFYDVVRRRWSVAVALLALIPVALNIRLIERTGMIRSETLYLLLTMVTFWALSRKDTRRAAWLAGAAVIAAALTRSIGITGLASVMLLWLLERRWARFLSLLLASSLTVGTWMTWTLLAPQQVVGRSYAADLAIGIGGGGVSTLVRLGQRVYRHALNMATTGIPSTLAVPTLPNTAIDNVAWLVVLVVLGLLGLVVVWKRWRVVALYLMLYLALVLVWPWIFSRFFLPLVPFLVLLMIAGSLARAKRYPRVAWGTAAAIVLLLCLGSGHKAMADLGTLRGCDRADALHSSGCLSPDQQSFVSAAQYVNSTLPRSAAVLTTKEATFAWYSGRRVLLSGLAIRVSADSFPAYLRSLGVDYVLLGHLTPRERKYLSVLLEENCRDFRLVRSFPPRTYLFQLAGGSDSGNGDDAACQALHAYRRDRTPLGQSGWW